MSTPACAITLPLEVAEVLPPLASAGWPVGEAFMGIGRASCWGRGEISGVAGTFKKKKIHILNGTGLHNNKDKAMHVLLDLSLYKSFLRHRPIFSSESIKPTVLNNHGTQMQSYILFC